eukprot:14626603-Ditylum_brightwellii.AAC.1
MTMSVMQHPAEVDYWKAGQSGAIVYPNLKIWMSYNRANIAQDMLWKVQDSIIATRNIYNRFMPWCAGDATIDKARIPYNTRKSC